MPEHLVIRPPSEARSLLVRVVRGCNWNRCAFCGIYDFFDTPFSERSLDEVLADIDTLHAMYGDIFRTAFLGDANPLHLETSFLVEVLRHLRRRFTRLERVTSYARASSLAKKSAEELRSIREAGLDRVHVGMESGSDRVLRLHKKGTTKEQLIDAGTKTMASGMELSYYVLLGLGGRDLAREHALDSADVLNAVKPHFARVRRLWIHPMSRLQAKISSGEFVEQTPEGTVHELRTIVAGLDASPMVLTCDHANNYIQIEGRVDMHKEDMLRIIDAFLALPADTREKHYRSVPSVI
ncbi:MAG TPA: radical SAM protein [Deltaproteobacteria bacterium]|nr:radical SAM protein [Deltaproteobacteria bacterium]